MEKIKVIIKRPDEAYGHIAHINNDLKTLQETVGGYIEAVEIGDNVVLICNEDGKNLGLESNFAIGEFPYKDIVVGTAIICGESEEGFGDVPIDLEDWKHILHSWDD